MRSGIDMSHLDASTRPQDDLFGHLNGRWLAEAEIPADRSSDGVFHSLRDTAEADVRAIIEQAAEQSEPGTLGAKVGDLYASFMDEERIEALGRQPLRADLDAIAAVTDAEGLVGLMARLQLEGSVGGFVAPYVNTDAHDSTRYIVYLQQAGLGLPDESYYHQDVLRRDPRGLRGPHRTDARAGRLGRGGGSGRGGRAAGHDPRDRHRRRTTGRRSRTAMRWPPTTGSRSGTCRRSPQSSVRARGCRPSVRRPSTSTRSWSASRATSRRCPGCSSASRSRRGATGWPGAWCAARPRCWTPRSCRPNFDFYGTTLSGVPSCGSAGSAAWALVEGVPGRGRRRALRRARTSRRRPRSAWSTLVDNLVAAYRAAISRSSTGWAPRRGRGPWRSWPRSPRRSATRTVARLLDAGDPGATTWSATCAGRPLHEAHRELAQARRPGGP